MTWLVVVMVATTLTVVAVLLWPLIRPPTRGADSDRTLAVLRDQLAEIDRDAARGLLQPDDAEVARLEVRRRVLAATRAAEAAPPTRVEPLARSLAIAGVAAGVPMIALVTYLGLGSPEGGRQIARGPTGDRPPSPAALDPQVPHDVAQTVERLTERLRTQTPDDEEGWAMLARSLSRMGRHREAADAHGQVARLRGGDPAVVSVQAEELIVAADGMVTPEAFALLKQVEARAPDDPRQRFYLALAQAQRGDVEGALELWVRLEADAPTDAQWRPGLADQIGRVAQDLGMPPERLAALRAQAAGGRPATAPPPIAVAPPASAAAPRGPSGADVAAAAQMGAAERGQMIEGMVASLAARLEENPGDREGWRRLARAYAVLGRFEPAQAALTRAIEGAPDPLRELREQATAVIEQARGQAPSPELELLVRAILARAPDDPQALWNLGLVERDRGNVAAARAAWTRLAATLPAESPDRAALQRRIDALN
jgi:cytochrome c-type biogenesis protein CcmH